MSFPYVTDVADLVASVTTYAEQMNKLVEWDASVADEVVRLLPRQNLWVAIPGGEQSFIVAPSKFSGHKGLDLASYKEHLSKPERSPERLDGTEADRRITSLGGCELRLSESEHPAAQAVRDFCNRFGKCAKANARVRIFGPLTEGERQTGGFAPQARQTELGTDNLLREGITIQQAKLALAIKFGCKPSNIKITISE